MANFGNHTIPIFQDDILTVKEYLTIAINVIFYHRWLNNNNYIEEQSNINKNISYIKIKDDSLDKEINNLLSQIDNYFPNQNKFQITLNFYSRLVPQLYFFTKLEGLWEKWNFLIKISDNNSTDKESKIRKFISTIIKELNSGKDFMPDIELNDFENMNNINNKGKNSNFPFEIKISNEFDQQSMLSIFKNMDIKNSFNKMI